MVFLLLFLAFLWAKWDRWFPPLDRPHHNHTAGHRFLECNIQNLWRSSQVFKWGHNVKGIIEQQYGFWNLPFKIHLHVYCWMFLSIGVWICGYWMKGQVCSQFLHFSEFVPHLHWCIFGTNQAVILLLESDVAYFCDSHTDSHTGKNSVYI